MRPPPCACRWLPLAEHGRIALRETDLHRSRAAVTKLIGMLGVTRLHDHAQRASHLLRAPHRLAERSGEHESDRRFGVSVSLLEEARLVRDLADAW